MDFFGLLLVLLLLLLLSLFGNQLSVDFHYTILALAFVAALRFLWRTAQKYKN